MSYSVMRNSKAEAAAELGISLGASEDEIRAAYKVIIECEKKFPGKNVFPDNCP